MDVRRVARAVFAAKNLAVLLVTVTHDTASAMVALRRKRVDSTLERVERMPLAIERYRKGVGVIISANFADSHDGLSCLPSRCSNVAKALPKLPKLSNVSQKVGWDNGQRRCGRMPTACVRSGRAVETAADSELEQRRCAAASLRSSKSFARRQPDAESSTRS
jgi:hypothetical protein